MLTRVSGLVLAALKAARLPYGWCDYDLVRDLSRVTAVHDVPGGSPSERPIESVGLQSVENLAGAMGEHVDRDSLRLFGELPAEFVGLVLDCPDVGLDVPRLGHGLDRLLQGAGSPHAFLDEEANVQLVDRVLVAVPVRVDPGHRRDPSPGRQELDRLELEHIVRVVTAVGRSSHRNDVALSYKRVVAQALELVELLCQGDVCIRRLLHPRFGRRCRALGSHGSCRLACEALRQAAGDAPVAVATLEPEDSLGRSERARDRCGRDAARFSATTLLCPTGIGMNGVSRLTLDSADPFREKYESLAK